MKLTLIAMLAALPLMAQEGTPQPPQEQAPAARKMDRAEFMAKYDVNKDGKIDEQERAAIKAARKAEFEKKMLEKFDTNKDGKLDEQEKEAMRAELAKHRPQGARPHGPRPEGARPEGKPNGPRHGGRKGHKPHGPKPEAKACPCPAAQGEPCKCGAPEGAPASEGKPCSCPAPAPEGAPAE